VIVPNTIGDTSVAAIQLDSKSIGVYEYLTLTAIGSITVWVLFSDKSITVLDVLNNGFPVGGDLYSMPLILKSSIVIDPATIWLATSDGEGDCRAIA